MTFTLTKHHGLGNDFLVFDLAQSDASLNWSERARRWCDRRFGIGADGLLLLPYFDGERTPDLPFATGSLQGLTSETADPGLLVRAALDGVAAGLAYCTAALDRLGVSSDSVTLVGGGSHHQAWRQAIADATGMTVIVREAGEAAARGAALQALALVTGTPIDQVITQARPAVEAEVAPRAGAREAFRLAERRVLIDRMRTNASAN